jgi:hypothetical protein
MATTVKAYYLNGATIGNVTLTWDDEGERGSRMYVNNFPVRKINPHSNGWTVFDVTWTDAHGNPHVNMKVKTKDYEQAIGGD